MFFSIGVQDSLKNSLDFLGFSKEDFIFQNKKDSAVIQYKFDTNYNFTMSINNQRQIKIFYTPGNLLFLDIQRVSNISDLNIVLTNWLYALEKEIKTISLQRKSDEEFNKKLNELEDKIKELNIDEGFSSEEAILFSDNLTKIELLFIEELKKNNQYLKNLNEDSKKFSQEIDILRIQLNTLTKTNWVKSLFIKFFNWKKRNPNATQAISSSTQNLIPKEIQEYAKDNMNALRIF